MFNIVLIGSVLAFWHLKECNECKIVYTWFNLLETVFYSFSSIIIIIIIIISLNYENLYTHFYFLFKF